MLHSLTYHFRIYCNPTSAAVAKKQWSQLTISIKIWTMQNFNNFNSRDVDISLSDPKIWIL